MGANWGAYMDQRYISIIVSCLWVVVFAILMKMPHGAYVLPTFLKSLTILVSSKEFPIGTDWMPDTEEKKHTRIGSGLEMG